MQAYVIPLEQLGMQDVDKVGGKNASLGEMISNLAASDVRVPGGFATTAQAYRDFLAHEGLEARIKATLATLNVDDVVALAKTGEQIRKWIVDAPLPARLEAEIREHYSKLDADADASFAVRSSATAEDMPDASFAGQQETFLNIHGIDNILHAIKEVFASLYNDRAISYRVHSGYNDIEVALSAGVQRMVRSDLGASGVMFTLDTESGFRDVVFITSSYGLGEMVVQGAVNPDEFYVHKPQLQAGFPALIRRGLGSKQQRMVFNTERAAGRSVKVEETTTEERNRFSLTDAEVLELARHAMEIEKHYGCPMDIEWGKDGLDGKLYIVQARPETVKSRAEDKAIEKFTLKKRGNVLSEGRAIGQKIGIGPVRIVESANDMHLVKDALASAFTSAGQRCSAARVLFVQEDIADKVATMLAGAMAELKVGDPGLLSTDVGPVIDADALCLLDEHAGRMRGAAKLIAQAPLDPEATAHGTFFAPTAWELQSLSQLTRENFGPALHLIRWKASELDQVIDAINATGYGLTLGIHSRIDETIDYIVSRAKVGNAYVNRNQIGAVVGVQPFGGQGLSGTGPKAGGPHYLPRFATEKTVTVNTTAAGGNASLLTLGD